jgi:hypothetical protein
MILGTTAEYHQLALNLLKDGDTCRILSRGNQQRPHVPPAGEGKSPHGHCVTHS